MNKIFIDHTLMLVRWTWALLGGGRSGQHVYWTCAMLIWLLVGLSFPYWWTEKYQLMTHPWQSIFCCGCGKHITSETTNRCKLIYSNLPNPTLYIFGKAIVECFEELYVDVDINQLLTNLQITFLCSSYLRYNLISWQHHLLLSMVILAPYFYF